MECVMKRVATAVTVRIAGDGPLWKLVSDEGGRILEIDCGRRRTEDGGVDERVFRREALMTECFSDWTEERLEGCLWC